MNIQPDSQIEPRGGAPRIADTHLTQRMATASPRARARITGGIYLLFFLTALLGEFFTQQAGISGLGVLPGDVAAAATNILAHESLYLLGVAFGLISTACYVAVTALFYQLFRPVSRSLAFIAAFFGLVGCAITAFGSLFQLAPLAVLGGSPYLSVFTVKQLQALALLFLNLNAQVGSIALVFFGLFQILIGYLIFRSTFLPRMLGVLMALAGFGWLIFLAPPLAALLLTYLEVLGILAEALLMLWLIVMGVNAERWNLTAQPNNALIKAS
jgi:Domain of unknown function (DUF4386)